MYVSINLVTFCVTPSMNSSLIYIHYTSYFFFIMVIYSQKIRNYNELEKIMIPISICIIAKNEEKHMETFLTRIFEHIKDFPVEVLIADTGSTDKTKEIISRFPVKLLNFTWIDDFSAARNFTLEQAANDWILVLDCDEYLETFDMNALQYFITHNSDCVGMITRKNHYPLNGGDSIYTDEVERFFNRNYFHYESIIHEQVRSIDGSNYKYVALPLVADHQGYSGTEEELLAKVKRNNTLLLKMLEENPNDPYLYFQLGQSYNAIHDDENACYYYGKGLEYDVDPALEYVQMMVIGYGYSLLHLERFDTALLFENIYEEFATTADFVNLMGLIYLRNGFPIKAMKEFLKATSFSTASVEGANTFIPTYNMGCINEVLGNLETAIILYKKCGNFQPALERLNALKENL